VLSQHPHSVFLFFGVSIPYVFTNYKGRDVYETPGVTGSVP